MITYRSRFLARAEVWFDDQASADTSVDWILYRQRSNPVPGTKSRSFYNRLVDLTVSEEELKAGLSEDTAYKIRRARDRDRIVCEWHDPRDPAVIGQFEKIYELFAGKKGLPGLNRSLLDSLAAAGALDMSSAKDSNGRTLVFHAYYRDANRASQLESPSLYRTFADSATRNFCGRANRYLTWKNILRYKSQGLKSFDFGGWHLGTDSHLLNINEFKRGFGGKIAREYQCEQIVTLKGRLVLGLAKLLERAKAYHRGRHAGPPDPQKAFPQVEALCGGGIAES